MSEETNQKKKVLVVVEDEPDIRLLIRMQLELDPRLEILGETGTAEEAIELTRSQLPGLIILDHQLQGHLMGLTAAPQLKEVAPQAKILLFSAFDLEKEAEASPAIDRFLSKSRFDLLLETVVEMLVLSPVSL